jgi:hypothetical protein
MMSLGMSRRRLLAGAASLGAATLLSSRTGPLHHRQVRAQGVDRRGMLTP